MTEAMIEAGRRAGPDPAAIYAAMEAVRKEEARARLIGQVAADMKRLIEAKGLKA